MNFFHGYQHSIVYTKKAPAQACMPYKNLVILYGMHAVQVLFGVNRTSYVRSYEYTLYTAPLHVGLARPWAFTRTWTSATTRIKRVHVLYRRVVRSTRRVGARYFGPLVPTRHTHMHSFPAISPYDPFAHVAHIFCLADKKTGSVQGRPCMQLTIITDRTVHIPRTVCHISGVYTLNFLSFKSSPSLWDQIVYSR